jgi:hypothetical protein
MSERGRSIGRAVVLGAVSIGAVLVPLALNIEGRQRGPEPHPQWETLLTEEAAAALVRGENPYDVSYEDGPLGQWPSENWLHLPYLPGILVFGQQSQPPASRGTAYATASSTDMASPSAKSFS